VSGLDAVLAHGLVAGALGQTLADSVALGALYALMAVGIGLVFGVLRLVNFAYGQLIMTGAYTLALTSEWPLGLSLAACVVAVVVLSLLMERTVFRPLRTQSPSVMLVATFAVSFLLQSIALLKFGALGEVAVSLSSLAEAVDVGGTQIRWISIVTVATAIVSLGLLALLLGRTRIGLEMRAAAADFETARLLGVRANRVIAVAVVLSGVLAAVAAIILTVQNPLVTPTFGLQETIIVLVAVVVGGIDRLSTATLGGFTIGFVTGVLGNELPADLRVYLPSAVFLLVIVVLLVRPSGLFSRRGAGAVERL
jgi:branched-chain amino acid transport system permease protein